MRRAGRLLLALNAALLLAGCATTRQHTFAEPSTGWQTRNGQLLYHSPQTRIAGDVLVRHSTDGSFDLVFSKGPGVTLLTMRTDARFARIEGPLSRGGWSGEMATVPDRFRGWIGLREAVLAAGAQRSVRSSTAAETFLLLF